MRKGDILLVTECGNKFYVEMEKSQDSQWNHPTDREGFQGRLSGDSQLGFSVPGYTGQGGAGDA